MHLKLLLTLAIGFVLIGTLQAQVNTKNADGSYNRYGYRDWRSSEDFKKYQKSNTNAFENVGKAPLVKHTSTLGELYEPIQSADDKARNNTCISGNCEDGYGIKQGTPNTRYKYEGEFKNGEPHGKGKLYDWEGYVLFDGSWLDGRYSYGRETRYKKEKAFGDGSINYYNLSLERVYEGNYINGRYEGYGVMSEFDKEQEMISTYDGYFKKGFKDSAGTMILYSSGKVNAFYVGGWKDNLREGQGVDSTLSGVYVGEFKNNLREGEGVAFWAYYKSKTDNLTTEYVGNWKEGKRDGFGTDYDINGRIEFEGMHTNDKRNGAGKLYKIDGTIAEGIWVDGVNKDVDPSSVPPAELVLKEINENFDNNNVNGWENYSFQRLEKGSYTIQSVGSNDKIVPLPGKISIESSDDWSFEVTLKKVSGPKTGNWGIGWDNAKFLINEQGIVWFLYGIRPVKGIGGRDCKVKKNFNTLLVVKQGKIIEASVNGKKVYSGDAENITSKTINLMQTGAEHKEKFLVEYSNVVFKRL